MEKEFQREIDYLRNGYLTYYILKIIEGLPRVQMHPYYALISQEIESDQRLRGGRSLLYSRLNFLLRNKFLDSYLGKSSNPKAKKKVRFYSLSEKGRQLLNQLSKEQKRIADSLLIYR